MAWYHKNGGMSHSVGTKQANTWGLADMSGNVGEWCEDWWGVYPGGSVTDPRGPKSGSYRVRRGGCWNGGADDARCANRGADSPGGRSDCLGFRLSLSFSP